MGVNYIYRLCQVCNGDGKKDKATEAEGEHEVICDACNGVGRVLWGEVRDEIIGDE